MKRILVGLMLVVLILSACAPEDNDNLQADNGNSYDQVPEDIIDTVGQTHIVQLAVRVVQEQITANYQLAPAQGSSYRYDSYGSSSYTGQIIEGKGILLVEIINGPEEYLGTAILKFVDLKAMALRPGFIAQVSCVVDYEVLNPSVNGTVFTQDALTYELDDCRLNTPKVSTEQG